MPLPLIAGRDGRLTNLDQAHSSRTPSQSNPFEPVNEVRKLTVKKWLLHPIRLHTVKACLATFFRTHFIVMAALTSRPLSSPSDVFSDNLDFF